MKFAIIKNGLVFNKIMVKDDDTFFIDHLHATDPEVQACVRIDELPKGEEPRVGDRYSRNRFQRRSKEDQRNRVDNYVELAKDMEPHPRKSQEEFEQLKNEREAQRLAVIAEAKK